MEDVYRKGIDAISHIGPHSYYHVLPTVDDLSRLRAIPEVSATADSTFKDMLLRLAPKAGLAIADADQDEIGEPGMDLAPVAAAVAAPAIPVAMHMPPPQPWEISCGHTTITLRADGFSHASSRRRAYCKCPWDGHIACFKYATLASYPEPWMAAAAIICYMRGGVHCQHS